MLIVDTLFAKDNLISPTKLHFALFIFALQKQYLLNLQCIVFLQNKENLTKIKFKN